MELSPCHFHVLSERLYQQRQYRSDFLTKVIGCDDFLVKSLMCQAVAQLGDFLNGVSLELSHSVLVGIRRKFSIKTQFCKSRPAIIGCGTCAVLMVYIPVEACPAIFA